MMKRAGGRRFLPIVFAICLIPSLSRAQAAPTDTDPSGDGKTAGPVEAGAKKGAPDQPAKESDIQQLQKQVDDLKKALGSEDPNFSLVLGVGSQVINPDASDYMNDSNVLHATNLGSATPQLLAGVSFRSHVPSLTRRWRNSEEIWQRHPWSGFVSLKFAPGASQVLNGYVIGGTYSIAKYLNALVGFALTPVNEPSPGFRVTAAQFVASQQKLGLDLNFDPNAMLANKRSAFDGFPITDPTGKLIYPGNPLTVHYRGGAVFGVSFPIYFRSFLKP
jgi:hypothetical protein